MLRIFLIIFLVWSPQWSSGQNTAIKPRDSFVFVGDVFSVWCNSSSLEAGSLQLRLVRPGVHNATVPIRSTSINGTLLQGTLNVTEELIGNNTIVCLSETLGRLDEITLYVQGHLHNISNVSFVWHYPSKELRLHWELGHGYMHGFIKVDVKMSVSNPVNKGGFACNTMTNESCVIKGLTQTRIYIFFRITLSLADWLVSMYHDTHINTSTDANNLFKRESPVRVNPQDSVKTGPPQELRSYKSESSECVNISWSNPQYFQLYKPKDLLYSVSVKNIKKEETFYQHLGIYTLESKSFEMPLKQCGLEPYCDYKLEVRLKPTSHDQWSEPGYLHATTKEDRPAHGPDVTSTSYWSGSCVSGTRDVYVYWKDCPEDVANGELMDFHVMFNSVPYKVRSKSNHVYAQIKCNEMYVVEVYSSTKVGLTQFPSTLTIPSEEEELSVPSDLNFMVTKMFSTLDSDAVKITFSWTHNIFPVVDNFTIIIYYCRSETFSPNVCIDNFKTVTVPIQQQSLQIDTLPKTANQFGFALLDNANNTRGITWTNCIFDNSIKPLRPSGVSAYGGKTRSSLVVKWTKQYCAQDNRAYILRYYVRYCTEKLSSCNGITVEGSASSAPINNLDEDVKYKITVQAESPAGKSPVSHPVFASPSVLVLDREEDAELLEVKIAIAVSLFALLLLAIMIVGFVRKCKHRKRLMKERINFDYDIFCTTGYGSSGLQK